MAGLTLVEIKKSPKIQKNSVVQLSDITTPEERAKIREQKEQVARKRRKFDEFDAYSAEILARFGYDAWKDWNNGIIPDEKMRRMVAAEQARAARDSLALEGVIAAMVGACIRVEKGSKKPQGPKIAQEIISKKIKQAKGEL